MVYLFKEIINLLIETENVILLEEQKGCQILSDRCIDNMDILPGMRRPDLILNQNYKYKRVMLG